jgi:hypothetical protein
MTMAVRLYMRLTVATLLIVALAAQARTLRADDSPLTIDQQETFMRKAKIGSAKGNKKGVTDTVRVTLTDGKISHDASVQRINERKLTYQLASGTTIINFKDTYVDNIAAWKLARLLGLDDMLPPTIERTYEGQNASFTWYIDNFQMDEGDRMAKKIQPPNQDDWNKEINVMHVFDQLIYNWDSNATNLLIDQKWRIWLIDQSRSFRPERTLLDPKMLSMCDRDLLARMRALDEATLMKVLQRYVTKDEIKGLLARRDLIVKFFTEKGDSALFDRPARR